MFKFLRKYNKWILAVGGTLLMIVFLIPQAIERWAQSAGSQRATRATLVTPGGEEDRVNLEDWEKVTAEFEVINRLSRFGGIPGLGEIHNAAHWYLLSREAEELGLVGPPGSIEMANQQMTAAQRDAVANAMPKYVGVVRLLRLYQQSADVSDHRLKQYASRMLHEVEADVVVIEADENESDYQPSEAELQQQMEQYADERPGEGEKGFGYRLPDRVKLEWIAVPAEMVRDAIRESDQMDNLSLRTHWARGLRNEDSEFPPIDENDYTIPDVVREDLLETLTDEQLESIAKFASDRLRANQRGLSYINGYAQLPDDWDQQRLSFASLTEQIEQEFSIPSPEYHATGEQWLTMEEVGDLPGIGDASTDRYGTRPRDLEQLVEGTRQIGASPVAQIQKGVAGPPLRTDDGSVYLFRIVDVDTSRPPRSVDEVREQLVTDLQQEHHYQQLQEQLSAIETIARDDGLLSLAMDYDALVEQATIALMDLNAQEPRPTPRRIPGIGIHEEVTATIIDHAMELPSDLSEVPIEDRVFAMPVNDRLAILVLEMNVNRPLSQENYIINAPTVRAMLLSDELGGGDDIRDMFSYENLVQRYRFQLFTPSGDEQALEDIEPVETETDTAVVES